MSTRKTVVEAGAWIIRRDQGDLRVYWNVDGWVFAPSNGIQFATKKSAERCIVLLCNGFGRAVEAISEPEAT